MAQQVIAPIVPNLGRLEEAIAGSSSIVFTSTDRKIIKERAGEVDRARSFGEIFKEQTITPKVENEETTVKSEQDIKALESRYRDHQRMLENSPIAQPKDKIEVSDEPAVIPPPNMLKLGEAKPEISPEKAEISQKTAAIAQELKLDPKEITTKFTLENEDLYSLVYRIKEHHLERILTNNRRDFMKMTEIIKKETLAAAKPEAKEWLEGELNKLTVAAAEYKLKLLGSLKTMGLNAGQSKNIKWLEKIAG